MPALLSLHLISINEGEYPVCDICALAGEGAKPKLDTNGDGKIEIINVRFVGDFDCVTLYEMGQRGELYDLMCGATQHEVYEICGCTTEPVKQTVTTPPFPATSFPEHRDRQRRSAT